MLKVVSVFILVFISSGVAYAQDYVEVTGNTVNVRLSPSENSEVVGQASKGMIFSLKGTSENWFEVVLPSGEYRYFHLSLGVPVDSVAELTDSEVVLRDACEEYISAERKANKEAEALDPDFMKQIDLSRMLTDKYKLEIHSKYKIPPARKVELTVWCVSN